MQRLQYYKIKKKNYNYYFLIVSLIISKLSYSEILNTFDMMPIEPSSLSSIEYVYSNESFFKKKKKIKAKKQNFNFNENISINFFGGKNYPYIIKFEIDETSSNNSISSNVNYSSVSSLKIGKLFAEKNNNFSFNHIPYILLGFGKINTIILLIVFKEKHLF